MRKILVLGASLALFSVMAFAESWSGTLVDATCAMQNQQSQPSQPSQPSLSQPPAQPGAEQGSMGASTSGSACAPTSTTTAFALKTVSGQSYQLDDAGNAKVIAAMKDRADRMKDEGTSTATGTTSTSASGMQVHATVKGTISNNIIKVDSIEVQ